MSDLEEQVEKRVAILRDSLELKLTKDVDSMLKSRFETTAKILGWAFSAVALLFGLLGIKTLSDIRGIAKTTAIDEVKKKLSIDDPNSEFRREFDTVVARGIIDSYLLSIAKSRQERFAPSILIAENDIRRLIDLVNNPNTSTKDFSDACEVLLKSQNASAQTIAPLLVSIGKAKDAKYKWIEDQPEKRAAIFHALRNEELNNVAVDIVGNAKSSRVLLFAAMTYLGRVYDGDAIQPLERLTTSKDEQTAFTALTQLGRIDPTSASISSWSKNLSSEASDETLTNALRLADTVAKPSSRSIFEADPDEKARVKLASELLVKVLDAEFVFRINTDVETSTSSLYVSRRKTFGTMRGVPSGILTSPVVQEVLRQAGPNIDLFKSRLRAFCIENDGHCSGVVRISLSAGGGVVIKSGVELTKATFSSNAVPTVVLEAATPEKNADVIVRWSDQDGVRQSDLLVRLVSPEKLGFQVVTRQHLGEESKED